MTHVYRRLFVLAAFLVMLKGGCGRQEQPPPTKPAEAPTVSTSTGSPSTNAVLPAHTGPALNKNAPASAAAAAEDDDAGLPRVLVIELTEVNRDNFSRPLEIMSDSHHDSAFYVRDGRLTLNAAAAKATDAAALSEQALTLGDAATPAEKCSVFITLITRFAGKGRQTTQTQYIALPKLPATIPAPPAAGDSVEVDPASVTDSSLLPALLNVRLYPPQVKSIEIQAAGDGVEVVLGELSVKAASGAERVKVFDVQRPIRVIRKALPASAIELEGAAGVTLPANEPVLPAIDYGDVGFATQLWVSCRSGVPLVVSEAREGGAP